MICPVLSTHYEDEWLDKDGKVTRRLFETYSTRRTFTDCLREECAWWIQPKGATDGECAMKATAISLYHMEL